MKEVYCPYCRSKKPMWKAGKRRQLDGAKKQQYKCQVCHRQTVKPKRRKRNGGYNNG